MSEVRIRRRDLRVAPTAAGLLLASAVLAMAVAAINYQLAAGYALTFLIAALIVIGLLHTARNLAGVRLHTDGAAPVFAGEHASLALVARNPARGRRFALSIDAPGMVQAQTFDVGAGAGEHLSIPLATRQRGWMPLPRFTVATTFPLGLWRARATWQPVAAADVAGVAGTVQTAKTAMRILVYPAPETPAAPLPAQAAADGDGAAGRDGQGDLIALRPYVAGDPPQRIAWKAVARSGANDLASLQLGEATQGDTVFAWQQLPPALDDEAKLSRLTRWIIDADQAGRRYSLHLPGTIIDSGAGPAHRARCLEALAVWGRS